VHINVPVACPAEPHLFTVTRYAHTVSAERQCSNRINECGRIAPPFNRLSDRGVKEETGSTECAAKNASLAERSWRRARPERTANLRGDVLRSHSLYGDANAASGAANINAARQMHQPSANHRRHSVVRPRDNRDAARQPKIARSKRTQRTDPGSWEHLRRECTLVESTRFAQQQRTLRGGE
jgi:hypothetical protein